MDKFEKYIEIPFEPVISLNSWEDFEQENHRLLKFLEQHKKEQGCYISAPRYRGQNNSNWKLETSLERAANKELFSMQDYFRIAEDAYTQLKETLTARSLLTFNAKENLRHFDALTNQKLHPDGLKVLADLAYLRHFGFPSPLLDWTLSANVAAFFAFQNRPVSDYVSIYTFIEYINLGKVLQRGKPRIEGIGHNIDVGDRHTNQESEYTTCFVEVDGQQHFTSHENVIASNTKAQDITIKFNIPSKERLTVLNKLKERKVSLSKLMNDLSPQTLLYDLSLDLFIS